MMKLDRTHPPIITLPARAPMPVLDSFLLPNGIRLSYQNTACRELVRFDLIVEAGLLLQSRPMVAMLTNLLLKEGTSRFDSEQVADFFDGYGAFTYYSYGPEYSVVNLCCPKKYFHKTLPLLYELYTDAVFPDSSLDISLAQTFQKMQIDRERVQVQALLQMNELLFGKQHPFGRILTENDFEGFNRDLLVDFHRRYYVPSRTKLVLTGDVDDSLLRLVEQLFGQCPAEASSLNSTDESPRLQPSPVGKWRFPKPGSSQVAVRFSLPTVAQTHPDFWAVKLLNTVLGGYFGSRLMKVVREEKGYTYGINSTHTVYRSTSYLDIDTQTALHYADDLVACVYQEIDRLCQEPVPEWEMRQLRHYLSGEYARMLDGPFAVADLYLSAESVGMPLKAYDQQMDAMLSMSAVDLQETAQRYLRPEFFYEVRVGDPSDE